MHSTQQNDRCQFAITHRFCAAAYTQLVAGLDHMAPIRPVSESETFSSSDRRMFWPLLGWLVTQEQGRRRDKNAGWTGHTWQSAVRAPSGVQGQSHWSVAEASWSWNPFSFSGHNGSGKNRLIHHILQTGESSSKRAPHSLLPSPVKKTRRICIDLRNNFRQKWSGPVQCPTQSTPWWRPCTRDTNMKDGLLFACRWRQFAENNRQRWWCTPSSGRRLTTHSNIDPLSRHLFPPSPVPLLFLTLFPPPYVFRSSCELVCGLRGSSLSVTAMSAYRRKKNTTIYCITLH